MNEDGYYIGNLILNGMGDGQPSQMLTVIPLPRRAAPLRTRMQIRRMQMLRNFVAQQLRTIPQISENTIGLRRMEQRQGGGNQQHGAQQHRQRRSQSEQRFRGTEEEEMEEFRRRFGGNSRISIARTGRRPRRFRVRVRARSLSSHARILQLIAATQQPPANDNNNNNINEDLRG